MTRSPRFARVASTWRSAESVTSSTYWQKILGEMVESPTWKQIAGQRQFTTTFMLGDEFQTFMAGTQADLKAALEAGR